MVQTRNQTIGQNYIKFWDIRGYDVAEDGKIVRKASIRDPAIKKPVTRDTIENKFIKVPHYFIERGRHLTPQAKWVWIVLKYFENHKTRQIFLRHSTIEELSGLSKTAVSKALKELEHNLWIKRQTAPAM